MQGAKLLEAVPKFEYARQTEAAHVESVRKSRARRVQRLVVTRGRLQHGSLKPGWSAVLPPPPASSSTLDALGRHSPVFGVGCAFEPRRWAHWKQATSNRRRYGHPSASVLIK